MDKKEITLILIIIIASIMLSLLINHNIQNTPTSDKKDSNINTSAKIKINYAIFYSDGNENHGEIITVNVGKENANKTVSMAVQLSKNKEIMNIGRYRDVKVDSEGNIMYSVGTHMSNYPDNCEIFINDGSKEIKHSFTLEEKSGTQTVYV